MTPGPWSTLRRSRDEPSAFTEFYAGQAQQLLAFFVRRTFDVQVALDLTAETFAQAFEHRARFRGATDAEAVGWLYGIARHQLSAYARKGRVGRQAIERLAVQVPRVGEDEYDRVVELAGLTTLRREVASALAGLRSEHRDALQLRVIEERPYPEVADALGVSEQTARARVSRALRRLTDALEATPSTEVAR